MKHHEEQDTLDPRTTHMTIEPAICDECKKRSKCQFREDKAQYKCPALRGVKR